MKNTGAMVIDDLKEIRVVLRDILRTMGIHSIYEATNGVEALDILSARDKNDQPLNPNIRVMICDVNMPKMNGLELLHEVKQRDDLKNIGVIIITGESTEKRILEAVKLGADAFVTKPYTIQTIEEKIRNVLKKRKVSKAH